MTVTRMNARIIAVTLAVSVLACGPELPRVSRIRAPDGRKADLIECETRSQCMRVASRCPKGYVIIDDGVDSIESSAQAVRVGQYGHAQAKTSTTYLLMVRCK